MNCTITATWHFRSGMLYVVQQGFPLEYLDALTPVLGDFEHHFPPLTLPDDIRRHVKRLLDWQKGYSTQELPTWEFHFEVVP